MRDTTGKSMWTDQGHRFDVVLNMQGWHRRARSIKRFEITGLNRNKYVKLFTAYLTYSADKLSFCK